MAFSTPVARGSAVDIVNNDSIAMNPSAAIAAGRFLVVGCSTKNLATADGASNNHSSVVDSKNHTWTKHGEYTETAGVAADGTTVSVWSTVVTTQLETTDTITLTTSGNIAEKIITATEVQFTTGMRVALAQLGVGQTAIAATVSSLVNKEHFLIGVFGAEGADQTKTADADYTERHDARSRNDAAATTIHVQTRIATLTTDTCTSTNWTNTEPIALLAAFTEELQALATENVKVSESPTPALTPLLGQVVDENVKVSDDATADIPVDNLSRQVADEHLKIDDIGQGTTQLIGVIHVTDGPVVAELDLIASVQEDVKTTDAVLQTLDPLEDAAQEDVKVSDEVTAGIFLSAEAQENVKGSDALLALLDPLEASPAESVKVSYLVDWLMTGDLSREIADEVVKLDDIGQGLTQLIGVIHVTDEVFAEVIEDTLIASVSEHVKVSDALLATLDPLQASLTENIKASDEVTAGLFLSAEATETVKASDSISATQDPLETVVLTENGKVSDSTSALFDPLITSALQEIVKISDEVTAGMFIFAEVTENVKVSEAVAVTLDPLEAVAQEHVKVSDAVERALEDGNMSREVTAEVVKIDDIGQGIVQLLGVIHVTDEVFAERIDDNVLTANPSEHVKASDTILALRLPLESLLSEHVKVVDASDNWVEMSKDEYVLVSDAVSAGLTPLLAPALTEGVRAADEVTAEAGMSALRLETVTLTDEVTTQLDPLQASALEQVRVSDEVLVGNDLIAQPSEAVLVSDAALPALTPEEATAQDAVQVVDQVSASLTVLEATLAESVRVTDAVFTGNDRIVEVEAEILRVADTVTTRIDPVQASAQDAVRVADAVTAALTVLPVLITESVRVTDAVFAGNDLIVDLTETLRTTDAVVVTLDPLVAAAQESARASEAATVAMDLAVEATESTRITDTALVAPDLVVNLAEHVRVIEEAVQAVVLDASDLLRNLSVVLRVTDEVTAQLETLEILLAEAMAVGDLVTVQRTLRLVTSIAFGDEALSDPMFNDEVLSDPMFNDEELLPVGS